MPNIWESFLSKKNIISGLNGISRLASNGTSTMPLGMDNPVTDEMTEAEALNARIGNGLQSSLKGFLDIKTISDNKNLSSIQKRMATGDSAINTASDIASNIPGIGGAIGGAVKAVNMLGGALIGTPKELKNYVGNDAVMQSSGYTGVADQASQTEANIGSYKGSGLFGKLLGGSKIKNQVKDANYMQNQVQGVLDTNSNVKTRAAGSTDLFGSSNLSKINGMNSTWTNGSVQYGKTGAKLDYKKIVREVKSKIERTPVKQVITHKEGGVMNVIVDGELHARKHNLKELEHLADAEITNKGVPVVTLSEGGEMTQTAEVEKDEIILHYKLTKTLETLSAKGDEDAMIQAGRILAMELVKNTKDSKSKILKNA